MPIFKLSTPLKKAPIKPAARSGSKTASVSASAVASASPEALEQMAMEAMADLSQKFPAWASGDVQKIKQYLAEAGGVFNEERTRVVREKIYPKAHDLKGQGATFGYPLITDIGAHMCQLMTQKTKFTADDLAILKADTLMMETVLWKRLSGDGGQKGSDILKRLK